MDQIDRHTQDVLRSSALEEPPNVKPVGEKAALAVGAAEVPPGQKSSYIQTGIGILQRTGAVLKKFAMFLGPGTMISVAYIDPDNFQTDVSSGVSFEFKLLFMVLLSNIIAIFLQALSTKLGSVTGLDLAQMNRAFLPRWMNVALWVVAEAAIICTDIGQVIGTAIALNLLAPKIPLMAGCALSIVDTLFILLFYQPEGSLRHLRLFEICIAALVLGVVVCFCIQLSMIEETPVGEVFRGFLPSAEIFQSDGLYQSCALLGGTIMPHALYLGSGIVQARLRDFDIKNDHDREPPSSDESSSISLYRPSLSAIQSCLSYSIAELCVTLFIVSIFVNSAILIVAATSLSEEAGDADLFGLYTLFSRSISSAAATLFALGLLFSGTSAGIVATMAGQMVCEGAMNWRISPFKRRLLTRTVSIIPSIIVAASVGRRGLSAALNGANVALSVALIFITAPLIWYTSRDKYMMVRTNTSSDDEFPTVPLESDPGFERQDAPTDTGAISLANNWVTLGSGALIWAIIAFMNVATWVLSGLGKVKAD
ncbi:MAG: hypothetical protein M1840_000522 [Geoglossum simile]|nr:MAG: hypothetical protein M1840_000522 [Geoglossum simile]